MLGSGQFDRGECMSTTMWSDFESIALSEVYGFVIILWHSEDMLSLSMVSCMCNNNTNNVGIAGNAG